MKKPTWLTGEAARFYARHAEPLYEDARLDDRSHDTFCLLCQVWALIRDTDPTASPQDGLRFIGLLKQFQAMAKQFGLMPNLARGQSGKPTDIGTALRRLVE